MSVETEAALRRCYLHRDRIELLKGMLAEEENKRTVAFQAYNRLCALCGKCERCGEPAATGRRWCDQLRQDCIDESIRKGSEAIGLGPDDYYDEEDIPF